MKNIFGFIFAGILMFAAGCEVHHSAGGILAVEHVCYEEPPFYTYADYCDYYPSGTCCAWYVYDVNGTACYEEWCEWDPTCGWEYEGDFCPVIR